MPTDREDLALKLREARENCGISQQAAADHLGLSRSLVAQIELGNRQVSPDELSRLAALYRRPVAEFSANLGEGDNDVLAEVLQSAPWLQDRRIRLRLQAFIGLCDEARVLERSLSRAPRIGPPHYDLAAPRSVPDAIAQGEHVAAQERRRLGFGAGLPIGSVSDLITSQGLRILRGDLPEDVIGLFVRHRSVGLLIIVNAKDAASERRFGLLHQYAQALFQRDRTVVVTTPLNADELVHVRASAFAAAFLLPSEGIEIAVASLDKGKPSRKAHTVFGLSAEDPIEAEVRSTPGSQALTYHDVVSVARTFGTGYRATVYRLVALDLISKSDGKDLLDLKRQRAAREFAHLFSPDVESKPQRMSEAEGDLEVRAEIAHLALEAYRRRLLDKNALIALAPKLHLAGLSERKLLEFGEAAR